MRKLSLQWRLTILTTVLITVLCGCLTFFLYKNGVYYIDTLQETVTDQGKTPEALYIEIPDNEWDNFASQFATEVLFLPRLILRCSTTASLSSSRIIWEE